MEDHSIPPLRVRYKGIFDLKTLLNFTKNWFYEYKYLYQETLNKEKYESPWGNEFEIKTWGFKKVTEYIRYEVFINFHLWESKEIIVKIDGKDTKMMEGRIEVQFSGKVVTDWQKKFEGDDKTLKKLEKFLNKFVLKKDIDIRNALVLEKQLIAYGQEVKKILKIAAS